MNIIKTQHIYIYNIYIYIYRTRILISICEKESVQVPFQPTSSSILAPQVATGGDRFVTDPDRSVFRVLQCLGTELCELILAMIYYMRKPQAHADSATPPKKKQSSPRPQMAAFGPCGTQQCGEHGGIMGPSQAMKNRQTTSTWMQRPAVFSKTETGPTDQI